jgi:hypothetical protein
MPRSTTNPAARESVCHTDERPAGAADHKAGTQPHAVHEVTRQRRADWIHEQKSTCNPAILKSGNMELLHDRRCGDAQRAACEVVRDRAERQQTDYPPPQPTYLDCHNILLF